MTEQTESKVQDDYLVEAYGLKKWFPVQKGFVENLLIAAGWLAISTYLSHILQCSGMYLFLGRKLVRIA